MSRLRFTFLISVCLVLMTVVTACGEDNTPDPYQEFVHAVPCDELAFVESNFVRLDDNGRFVGRVYGKPLDISDTTVVFIAANSFQDADTVMCRHLLPLSATQRVSRNNGTVVCRLQDADGKPQGTVSLYPDNEMVMDGVKAIARMAFEDGATLRHVSCVYFIPSNKWPDNDYIAHRKGESMLVESYDLVNGEMVYGPRRYTCVADADAGQPAYFISFTTDKLKIGENVLPIIDNQMANATDLYNVMQQCLSNGTAETVFGSEHFLTRSIAQDSFIEMWCHKYVKSSVVLYGLGVNDTICNYDWYVDMEPIESGSVFHRVVNLVKL